MRAKRWEILRVLLFALAIFAVGLSFLLPGAREYSAHEKRYLNPAPALNGRELLSGRFAQETEAYMADHLPGRDALVGLAAYYDLLSGRQNTEDILRGRSGRLYERPAVWDRARAEANLEALSAFSEAIGQPVDLMLIPSAGYVLRADLPGLHDSYEDAALIRRCEELAGDRLRPVELLPLFDGAEGAEGLYYRTDHHWTSLGAWTAAECFLTGHGREITPRQDYAIRSVPGFTGSTYARSALWLTAPESVELWDCGQSFLVSTSEGEGAHEGLFYEQRLAEDDKYTVFLDGNHGLVRIDNQSPGARGKLLVIRDSFSNCLGGFLAEGYRTVVLADLRYYKQPLTQLCREEGFDDVLAAYSLSNFLTDTNLVWLA